MRLLKTIILTLTVFLAGSTILWAEEPKQKNLDEVFERAVIMPFTYHNKVFLKGQKTDLYGDYKLFQKSGRVLVPIRLMGLLAAELDENNSYWDVQWDAQKPNDVILTNHALQKTIKLKVNSKTIYINNEPRTLDVPPQKIEGRIVLPLRGIGETLGKNVAWLDGLIIFSNEAIDLQSPQTKELKAKIKAQLIDSRKPLSDEQRATLIAKYGDTVYYTLDSYDHKQIAGLYEKTGNKQAIKIELPGEESFTNCQLINNELYYFSKVNGKNELHVFNFASNKSRKLCTIEQWNPGDGWLGDMKILDKDFYVVLHSGDITMGGESVYKLENEQLKEIAGGKSITNFAAAGEYFYYTDFRFMTNTADNLFKLNLNTREKEKLGINGYTYGIFRTIDEQGVSYSGNSPFYLEDGYIYTLGYQESDEKDLPCIYKISTDGKTQSKLTEPAQKFWLIDQTIYYIDLNTGYLVRADLEGNNQKILVAKKVIDCKFLDGNIYYTVNKYNNTDNLGKLYKYNIASGKETKLSEQSASEFFVGKAGVYFKSDGYDLGLYKIDAPGKISCLVADSIDTALLTDSGIVYTLRYQERVYAEK
ncbi:DUF5050 domain-containing protein [Bacillota bacterium LX-D]|nr:DUF5050 domain-containing protein [Bacillota bacterium LX-D]